MVQVGHVSQSDGVGLGDAPCRQQRRIGAVYVVLLAVAT
jgi:hypothetical protein